MFCITDETCRRFTFAEILILAAVNVRTVRRGSQGVVGPETVGAQTLSANPLIGKALRNAVQL